MPRQSKGPRLQLRKARSKRQAHWVILDTRDGRHEESTGCGAHDRVGAERALCAYIAQKHVVVASIDERDPAELPVADILSLYTKDVAPQHARPKSATAAITALLDFFGEDMLVDLNGVRCREFITQCSTPSVARHHLEYLRAAINHHRKEGLCSKIVEIALPPAPPARERWLTRSEAAQVILSAWRYREIQRGVETDKKPRQQTAKFTLVALYTGTRAALVCGAALQPTVGHGWIDLERGLFYRKPAGVKVTKKRAPPIPLPPRLLVHLRRWKSQGQKFAVEFNGLPIKSVAKSFRNTVRELKLEGVSPHTLRHTAATWMMQASTDPWEAAGYLGMSVKTLLEHYGHHHPKHLEGAKTAFARLRIVGRSVGPEVAKVG